jgi:hypothetical protein
MHLSSQQIINQLDQPHELERMYRQAPEAFKKAFADVWAQQPQSQSTSPVLAVWSARLHFQEVEEPLRYTGKTNEFWMMAMFAIMAGLLTRLFIYFVEEKLLAPISIVFGVVTLLAAYFVYRNAPHKRIWITIGCTVLGVGVYLNVLSAWGGFNMDLAYLHTPIVLWVLIGLAFVGNEYASVNKRIAYLKFNGELAILYASMAISGMLLSALTMALFRFLDLQIEEFYFENVVVFGAAFLLIVAAYLVVGNLKLAKHIAPYLAKIFSPLVLLTLIVFLIAIIAVGKNPFLDRDFLLAFNGVLISVLAVCVFSITERGTDAKRTIFDTINFALLTIALAIGAIALSAVWYRLSMYGLTPNRVAVLGINMLLLIHFGWMLVAYVRFLRQKTDLMSIHRAVVQYLPIYGLWAAFVSLAFPWIF